MDVADRRVRERAPDGRRRGGRGRLRALGRLVGDKAGVSPSSCCSWSRSACTIPTSCAPGTCSDGPAVGVRRDPRPRHGVRARDARGRPVRRWDVRAHDLYQRDPHARRLEPVAGGGRRHPHRRGLRRPQRRLRHRHAGALVHRDPGNALGLPRARAGDLRGPPDRRCAAGQLFVTIAGGNVAGVPAAVWVLAGPAVLLTVVLARTRFGGRCGPSGPTPTPPRSPASPPPGADRRPDALRGLRRHRRRAHPAFFASGDPTIGVGYELLAIAACIIGGTPLRGGTGSIPGAVLGSLILSVVAAALVFFGVPINWTTFATGAVILAAVALDASSGASATSTRDS